MSEPRFVEVRAADDGRTVEGTVVKYGDKADIAGIFRESVEPGAFEYKDVVLNLAHNRTAPLARTGGGMTFEDGPAGLSFRATLARTTAAADAVELIRAGVVRGASVEMEVHDDEWTMRGKERIIRRATLHGLALVARPAYPESSIALRERIVEGWRVGNRRLYYGV